MAWGESFGGRLSTCRGNECRERKTFTKNNTLNNTRNNTYKNRCYTPLCAGFVVRFWHFLTIFGRRGACARPRRYFSHRFAKKKPKKTPIDFSEESICRNAQKNVLLKINNKKKKKTQLNDSFKSPQLMRLSLFITDE